MAESQATAPQTGAPEAGASQAGASPATTRRGRLGALVRWDTVVALLVVVVLIYGFTGVANFGSAINLSFLIGNTIAIAMVALPMTMLVVAGEVDLSVGSMVGLSSALMGALWNANWPIVYLIVFCLAAGALGGLLNGWLVTRTPSSSTPCCW